MLVLSSACVDINFLFSPFSDAREWAQERMGHGNEDAEADQRANRHGRNGGDPNVYRPKGLPKKY